MSEKDDKIGLYYRGFILDKKKSNIQIEKLLIGFNTVKLSSDLFKIYKGKLICDVAPTSNIKKINFDVDNDTEQITNYHYTVYLLDFTFNDYDYIFCFIPEKSLFPFIFPNSNYIFYRFDLLKICSSFFQLKNSPLLKLTRLNSKLNYDKDESVTSISFYGNNNLQSNVIRKFLRLYPIDVEDEVKYNPFEEETPLIDPKSCKITFNDNKNLFSLNSDSTGNFSFYLGKSQNFLFLFEILKFVFKADAIVNADASPLKRTSISLEKIEN